MTYNINAAFREAVARAGRSHRQISRDSGVHYVSVGRWISGETIPHITELDAALTSMGYGLRVIELRTGKVIDP